MIYILSGNDLAKRNAYIKKLTKDSEHVYLQGRDVSKYSLLDYATSRSLFGDSPVVYIENIITEGDITLDARDLSVLQSSSTIFIFLEDKLLKKDESKYKKYSTIEYFEEKILKKSSEFNSFAIADLYGQRDKIGTWVLYREAIEHGVEPEAISGMLFWKIKSMILSNNKTFSIIDLKNQSKGIISLYHRAHLGECDFVIGLEQFILSSLAR